MDAFAVTAVVTTPPLSDERLAQLRGHHEDLADGGSFDILAASTEPVSGAMSMITATMSTGDADAVHVARKVSELLGIEHSLVDVVARPARRRVGALPDPSPQKLNDKIAQQEQRLDNDRVRLKALEDRVTALEQAAPTPVATSFPEGSPPVSEQPGASGGARSRPA